MATLQRFLLLAGVYITACLLTSCRLTDYEIVLPVHNAQFIDQLPDRVLIRYQTIPESITLNGIPIQHLFIFSNGQAIAGGEDLQGYFRQGQNNLAVDGNRFGPRRFFYLDNEGPRVVIQSTRYNDLVTLHGEFKDPAGTYAATLNGVPVSLENDQFNVTVAPAALYTFEIEDNYAQRATHHFAARDTIIEDVLKLRIDQEGIDALIPAVQEALEQQDLAALLGTVGANTLLNTNISFSTPSYSITEQIQVCRRVCVDFNIFDICIDFRDVCDLVSQVTSFPSLTFNLLRLNATLTTLEFAELDIQRLDLNSGNGWQGITLGAVAEDVNLGIRVNVDILGIGSAAEAALRFFGLYNQLGFLAGQFNININLNSIGIQADLGLEAENGDVDISVQRIDEVQVNGLTSAFQFDINLPAAINNFGFGLAGRITNALENGLNAARATIMNTVLGTIVPAIANLILDPLINELQVRVGATVNNGAYLTALVGVERLQVVNDNNELLVTLNGRIGTETADPNTTGITLGLNLGFPDLLGLENDILPNVIGIPSTLGPAPGIVGDSPGFYFTPTAVPDPENLDNINLVASSNLINQAIFAVYEAGLLSPVINIADQLNDAGYYLITDPDNANTRILLQPSMAPSLSFRGHTQSVAYINVDNFRVVYQRLNAAGKWEDAQAVTLSFAIPVQLSTDGNTGLQLGMIYPDLDLQYESVRFIDFRLQLPTRLFVVKGIAALLVDQINRGLTMIRLPESLVLGIEEAALTINPGTIRTVGKPRRHFAFSAGLQGQ